jgi:hypothetical protein
MRKLTLALIVIAFVLYTVAFGSRSARTVFDYDNPAMALG